MMCGHRRPGTLNAAQEKDRMRGWPGL